MTDFRALGKRAMAAGFRLEPGCAVVTKGKGWLSRSGFGRVSAIGAGLLHMASGGTWSDDGVTPWFDDPTGCTTGALLAQVREAWENPDLSVLRVPGGWQVYERWPCPWGGTHPTEAEALVAALEAAKGRE